MSRGWQGSQRNPLVTKPEKSISMLQPHSHRAATKTTNGSPRQSDRQTGSNGGDAVARCESGA